MARYRTKDSTDMAWNRVRRRLTRELDTELQNAREEMLNDLLSKAWYDYSKALGEGRVPEVQSHYTHLVSKVIADTVPKLAERVVDSEPDLD